jgi:hypothetical protein
MGVIGTKQHGGPHGVPRAVWCQSHPSVMQFYSTIVMHFYLAVDTWRLASESNRCGEVWEMPGESLYRLLNFANTFGIQDASLYHCTAAGHRILYAELVAGTLRSMASKKHDNL